MTIILNGDTGINNGAGSLDASAYTGSYTDGIVTDYTTGLGRISVGSSDGIAFYRGGIANTESIRIDSSGNVGIGTSSPSGYPNAKILDVYGTGSSVGQLVLEGGNGTNFLTAYSGINSADLPAIYFNQGLRFGTAVSKDASGFAERMRIDSSGNLGLGVTPSAWSSYKAFQVGNGSLINYSPTNETSIVANGYYDGTSFKYINTAAATRYVQSGGAHNWGVAPSGTAGNPITFTQAMTLDSNGNLGIGTSSPAARLHSSGYIISGASGGTDGSFILKRASDGVTVGSLLADSANSLMSLQTGYGVLAFSSNSTERMRIDSSGNLLVGITSTIGVQAKLNVNGGINGAPSLSNGGGLNITSKFGPYNDNSAHATTGTDGISNTTGAIHITTTAGLTTIPFYANGGAGVAWSCTYMTPGTGTWTYANGGWSISFTQAGSGGNTFTVSMSGGTGDITVTRTAGSQSYTFWIQKLAQL